MSRIIREFLPYYDERPSKVKALIIHCAAHSGKEMIEVLREKQLSTHYIIDEDGQIYQTVSETKRAWHAGVSSWRNMDNLNHYSIGIELSSTSMGQSEYPFKQIDSLCKLSRQIIRHYQIPATNIAAHSDVAPTRKPDPGKAFPWQYLAAKGVGQWYDLKDKDKMQLDDVEKLLQIIGYNTSDLAAASYAFCRHFIPEAVSYNADIRAVIENVYPQDFVLPAQYLPILKAVAWKYCKNAKKRLS